MNLKNNLLKNFNRRGVKMLFDVIVNSLIDFFKDLKKVNYNNKSRKIIDLLKKDGLSIGEILSIKDDFYWEVFIDDYVAEEAEKEGEPFDVDDNAECDYVMELILEKDDELKREILKKLK